MARPQRMMSRIVTTSRPAPIITAAKIQNRASSQSWPRNSSISTAMPSTAPRMVSPINAEMIVRVMAWGSLFPAGTERRSDAMAVAVIVVVPVAVLGRGRGDPGERRRQDREQAARIDRPARRRSPGRPVAFPPDVRRLGLPLDRGQRHQVDHRLDPVTVGQLDVRA